MVPDIDGQGESQIPIKIHRSRDVSDLYTKAMKLIKENYQFEDNDYDIVLLYRNHIINKSNSLKQEGIESNCQVYVCMQRKNYTFKEVLDNRSLNESRLSAAPPSTSRLEEQSSGMGVDQLVPIELIPQQPKAGYKTEPSYLELVRMSLRKLQNVPNFKIYNEHGSIEFIGDTDLTGVDLGKIVTIVPGEAEVYDDQDPTTIKPPVG